jgi:5-methylcytosine-specific restriction endonuclease McrA
MKKDRKRKLRAKLMRKQKNCFYCNRVLTKENRTIDHLVPVAEGGSNAIGNLRLACKYCNSKKGDKLLTALPH